MWLSGTGPVAGWVNTRVFDETGDSEKAIGWAPFVLDSNGNGKRDDFTEPGQPTDPGKDMRITGGSGPYAVMPNPKDGAIWYTVGVVGGQAGFMRFDPKTGKATEWPSPGGPKSQPYGITSYNDIIWYSESAVRPNTLARFDPKTEKIQTWVIPSGGGVVRNMMATKEGNLVLAESGVNKVALVEVQK